MSRDPFKGFIASPSTLNGQTYVTNNPASLRDPSGLMGIILPPARPTGKSKALGCGSEAHGALDVGGFINPIADGINAGIYLCEGDIVSATISGISIVPVGDVLKWFKHIFKWGNRFGGLSRASEFGISSYRDLSRRLAGTSLQAHHIIPRRFAVQIGGNVRDWAAVAVTEAEHTAFTNAWRTAIGYGAGTANATRQQILDAARQIYASNPALLEQIPTR